MPDATEATAATTEASDANVSADSILAEALAAMDKGAETPAEPTADGGETAEATSTEETPAEPVKEPEPKPDDAVSLAQARKMLAAAQEKERAADAKVAAAEAKLTSAEKTFIESLRKAPKATLAKHGVDMDDLIDASLSEESGTAPAPAAGKPSPEIAELRQRLERAEKLLEQRTEVDQQTKIDAAIARVQADVAKDARFPLINAKGMGSLVTDFMVEYHQIHGKPVSWDRAAQIVEADLAKLTGGAPKAPAPKPAVAPAAKPAASTTLTNSDVRTAVPSTEDDLPSDPDKMLAALVERDEQRKRAARAS